MVFKSLIPALVAIMMTGTALAHSPEKVRDDAKNRQAAQKVRCEKFLARPDKELDKSSPVIQAMLKRCQAQDEGSKDGEGEHDQGHH
ncbi:hypothetical protein [Litorivivens sp.]|uniref:hypothetical protein n=1 Tax=Litorivivens sp. TaxID=2020868 RepID=UPI003561418D